MKTKKIFMLTLIALVGLSCTKEVNAPEEQIKPQEEQNLIPMTFMARMEDSGTKTEINTSTGAVSWSAGDAVKFMWDLGANKEGNASGSALSSKMTLLDEGAASFTASVNEDFGNATSAYSSRHMYVVYPASTTMYYFSNYDEYAGTLPNKNGHLYVEIPSAQSGKFEDASIALAKWNNPSSQLEFKNLCGLLQVKVADASVKYIKVSSDEDIAGLLDVTFTREGYAGIPVERAGDGVVAGIKEITVTIAEPKSAETEYYIAVRPCDISNLYVSLYDSGNNLIGDKMSGNVLSVARKQVRKLGTLATGFADRLYFTQDGSGNKDGSSWDNAFASSSLTTEMSRTTQINKSFYLGAGNYEVANKACKPADGSIVKIYGGYPATPSGYSLAGRNTSSYTSKIYSSGNRSFYTQNGDWLFDGITFTSTGYTGTAGGAAMLLLSGTDKATVNNCKFEDSSAAMNNKGVVRVAVDASFTNCSFSNNSTAGAGGAMWVVSSAEVTLKGCSFSGNSAKGGGAINVEGSLNATDCTFSGNSVTDEGYNGGAILVNNVGATISLDGCTFSGNSTDNLGGAIHFQDRTGACAISNCTFTGNTTTREDIIGPNKENIGHGSAISTAGAGGGVITVEKCSFIGNTAAHCGAIFVRSNPFRFIDCDFIDNQTSNADYHGSSIYIDRAFSAYFERCYFSYSTESCNASGNFTGKGITVDVSGTSSAGGSAGFNNCVFAGSWGGSSVQQLMVDASLAKATIVNSTFFDQTTGGNLRLKNGTLNVINSIVVNAASNGAGGTYGSVNETAGTTLNMDYTWYTKTNAAATENINNSLVGVQVYLDNNANTNFVNGWYKTNAFAMYGDNQTKTQTANGWTNHYYEWSNLPTATGIESYTYPSLTTVGTLVNTADSDFYTWLNTNGYLGKDARGVARNTSAMWPGSYELPGTRASVPAFNLK